jgi:arabinofuranan 3-O-arabinosyltransferase
VGTITVRFASNGPYRVGLLGGLALLPLLLMLALVPPRRPEAAGPAAAPWAPGALAGLGVIAAGAAIAGVGGVAVFGAALLGARLLRHRRRLFDRLTLVVAPAGLILAGALLARYPWRSVDGYIGHSAWVQLPALVAVAALAVSALENDTAAKPST